MAHMNFTARSIDSLKPPISGRLEYWDESFPGFGIRLTEKGVKTWVLMYRMEASKTLRRFSLGRFPYLTLADARDKARAALRNIAAGVDPGKQKAIERRAETFHQVAELFLNEHSKKKKKSWKEDERIITRELLPHFGSQKAKNIARRDVKALLNKIVDRGSPIQANRTLAVTRKIFNFAIQEEFIDTNPCWSIPAPAPEKQRDRVLSLDEIISLWFYLELETANIQMFYKLVLLTAQRPGEVLAMRWEELDLKTGWWTIPASKTKNNLSHRVPLSFLATNILREHRLRTGPSIWVLPSSRRAGPIENTKSSLKRIKTATALNFVPHDLRRSAASHMTSLSIPRLTVSKVLNHVERGVTAVYDRHSYDEEKKRALSIWNEEVYRQLTSRNPFHQTPLR